MEANRTTGNMERGGGHMQGRSGSPRGDGPQSSGNLYGQATEAMSDVADRASEMWDEAYDQGQRYYREGSRMVGNVGGSTLAIALVAGAVGYAIAYMAHGQRSYSGRESVPDYARTRGGHGNRWNGGSR